MTTTSDRDAKGREHADEVIQTELARKGITLADLARATAVFEVVRTVAEPSLKAHAAGSGPGPEGSVERQRWLWLCGYGSTATTALDSLERFRAKYREDGWYLVYDPTYCKDCALWWDSKAGCWRLAEGGTRADGHYNSPRRIVQP